VEQKTPMPDEFLPLEHFRRLFNRWWVIALCIILGCALGLALVQLQTPVYEAKASFFVTVDLNLFPIPETPLDRFQYNEDMALAAVDGVLRSNEVIMMVVEQAQAQGLPITIDNMLFDTSVTRRHAIWEAAYRSADPALAQAAVELWAEIGYQVMLEWQQRGTIVNYVIFTPPTPAGLPQEPIQAGRGQFLTGGSLAGFAVGVILANLLARPGRGQRPKTEPD